MRQTLHGIALLMLPAVAFLLASCGDSEETIHSDFPLLELSTELVELGVVEQGEDATRTVWLSNLGDLPMGITAIELGAHDRSVPNFSVSWSLSELECTEGADTARDSGGGAETGGPSTDDTGIDEVPEGAIAVLHEGCRLPVHVSFTPEALGTQWGSLTIHTGTGYLTGGSVAVPVYFSDPLHSRRLIYLMGEGERGKANILVQPQRHDYGHLWPGTDDKAFIAIQNAGDGDLTVQAPTLGGCADSFEITAVGFEGASAMIEPGISTFVEVTFTPASTDAAYCTMFVDSDDEDSPRVEVDLLANSGVNQDNVPPTVFIRSPEVGYQYAGGEAGSLQLQLNIFDLNQPADTLSCRVKSMVLGEGATVAQCEADDVSGLVYVDVPYASVGSGIDTIRVQVTDASGVISYASISVLWHADFPANDDDGDGWGDEADADGKFDCDDLDTATYPHAAELADGSDNDCDGVIDEGTEAYDDDGDSYSEDDGDCNDYDDEVFTGAWESADYKDNDCDGVVDEGTSLYDDDGDGYTDMEGDCDDADASVHPSAIEHCDGIDNDCDGLRDDNDPDGCVEIDSVPYVVGGIKLEQTACEPGDAIAASVFVYDADGQSIDYAWSGDEGLVIQPLSGSPEVTVTCPAPSSFGGSVHSLYVYVTDMDQNPVWVFDEMWVHRAGELYRPYAQVVRQAGSCATGAAIPALSLAWLALVGAVIRRRREE